MQKIVFTNGGSAMLIMRCPPTEKEYLIPRALSPQISSISPLSKGVPMEARITFSDIVIVQDGQKKGRVSIYGDEVRVEQDEAEFSFGLQHVYGVVTYPTCSLQLLGPPHYETPSKTLVSIMLDAKITLKTIFRISDVTPNHSGAHRNADVGIFTTISSTRTINNISELYVRKDQAPAFQSQNRELASVQAEREEKESEVGIPFEAPEVHLPTVMELVKHDRLVYASQNEGLLSIVLFLKQWASPQMFYRTKLSTSIPPSFTTSFNDQGSIVGTGSIVEGFEATGQKEFIPLGSYNGLDCDVKPEFEGRYGEKLISLTVVLKNLVNMTVPVIIVYEGDRFTTKKEQFHTSTWFTQPTIHMDWYGADNLRKHIVHIKEGMGKTIKFVTTDEERAKHE